MVELLDHFTWWSSRPPSTTCILLFKSSSSFVAVSLSILPNSCFLGFLIMGSIVKRTGSGCQLKFEYVFDPFISLCHGNQSIEKNGLFNVDIVFVYFYFLLKFSQIFACVIYLHALNRWLIIKIQSSGSPEALDVTTYQSILSQSFRCAFLLLLGLHLTWFSAWVSLRLSGQNIVEKIVHCCSVLYDFPPWKLQTPATEKDILKMYLTYKEKYGNIQILKYVYMCNERCYQLKHGKRERGQNRGYVGIHTTSNSKENI